MGCGIAARLELRLMPEVRVGARAQAELKQGHTFRVRDRVGVWGQGGLR